MDLWAVKYAGRQSRIWSCGRFIGPTRPSAGVLPDYCQVAVSLT